MYFTKVKIKNYKSFSVEVNELKLNKNITTIIGKNGSGKSNLLEALSEIKFFQKSVFQKKRNKLSRDDAIEIEAELDFDESDGVDLKNLVNRYTKAIFREGQICELEGALVELIYTDKELNKCKSDLFDLIDKIQSKYMDAEIKKLILNWLNEPINICLVEHNNQIFSKIKNVAIPRLTEIEQHSAKQLLDTIIERCFYYEQLLPNIFLFNPQGYNTKYSQDILSKIDNPDNRNAKDLLQAAGIDAVDLITAMTSSTDPGLKVKKKREIDEKLDKNLSSEFSQFYNFGEVKIIISVENGYFDLLVDTDSYPLPFSERSTGLRWYLDLFIQLKHQNLLNKKVLLLIDEPGIQLHIDAQQELLRLFNNLSQKNQIVYTTHSPFMIDTENLSTIRLVERVDGKTHIYNKLHSAEIDQASKMETLSPLIRALGFSPRFNIGPKYDTLNVIVEGISDYYYILGAAIHCGINTDGINIIPCVGVNAIHNVASILIGWNCSFKIVIDYDTQAFNEISDLNKLALKEQIDFFTYNLQLIDKDDMRVNPFTVENMFDDSDKANFEQGEKHLSSLKFYEMSKNKEFELSQLSKNKFIKLFNALGICKTNKS